MMKLTREQKMMLIQLVNEGREKEAERMHLRLVYEYEHKTAGELSIYDLLFDEANNGNEEWMDNFIMDLSYESSYYGDDINDYTQELECNDIDLEYTEVRHIQVLLNIISESCTMGSIFRYTDEATGDKLTILEDRILARSLDGRSEEIALDPRIMSLVCRDCPGLLVAMEEYVNSL